MVEIIFNEKKRLIPDVLDHSIIAFYVYKNLYQRPGILLIIHFSFSNRFMIWNNQWKFQHSSFTKDNCFNFKYK